jgi:hypothetical protein
MLLHFYALGLVLLAALPAVMVVKNLALFRRLTDKTIPSCKVSVLIPARDEEGSIAECVLQVLACPTGTNLQMEVLVMDDSSTDRTREICDAIARLDDRLRVLSAAALPAGWNGKQHACWQLAQAALGDWLLFIDADVRLTCDAIPRMLAVAQAERLELLSGFPQQVTVTFFERLLIPLMHFILLGYLPLGRMRASTAPAFAAGCGQLFLVRRDAYMTCGGHRTIANSRHDGIKLPRAFRQHGLKTDIFDAQDVATCRMYHSAQEVFCGLMKNATEGIGSPRTIVPFTLLLAGGALLPLPSLIVALVYDWSYTLVSELLLATGLSYLARVLLAVRFQQSWTSAALHPLGVATFLAIQWAALLAESLGMRIRWRGRV